MKFLFNSMLCLLVFFFNDSFSDPVRIIDIYNVSEYKLSSLDPDKPCASFQIPASTHKPITIDFKNQQTIECTLVSLENISCGLILELYSSKILTVKAFGKCLTAKPFPRTQRIHGLKIFNKSP